MRQFWTCVAAILVSGCSAERTATPDPEPPLDPVAERVKSLISRINDNPDKLHIDLTPAVGQPRRIGKPALLPCLELMLTDDVYTRLRAQRVIEGVVMIQHGFVFGQ